MDRFTPFFIVLFIQLASNTAFAVHIVQRCLTPGSAENFAVGYDHVKYFVLADGPYGVLKSDPYSDTGFCLFFKNDVFNSIGHFPVKHCAYDVGIIEDQRISWDPVLLAADGDSGLSIFLGDTGTDWHHWKTIPIPGKSRSLGFFGDTILVAGDSGLSIFAPHCSTAQHCMPRLDTYSSVYRESSLSRGAEDIAVDRSTAFVLTAWGDIVFFKLIPPVKPVHILRTRHDTCAIVVGNSVAYVVSGNIFAGYDLQFSYDAIEPPEIGNNAPLFNEGLFGGHGEDIVLYEKYAYIAVHSTATLNSFNGIVVYDVSDAHHPRFADSCRTPGNARGIFVDSAFIYLADGDSGIAVLNNDLPRISTIRNGRPIVPVKSPDIQSSGKISRMELFSLNGRRIRSIHFTGQAATHSIKASIPPGIYHGVFEIDGYRHTRIVPVLNETSGLR